MAKSIGYFGQRLLKNGENGFLMHLFECLFLKRQDSMSYVQFFFRTFGAELAYSLRLTA